MTEDEAFKAIKDALAEVADLDEEQLAAITMESELKDDELIDSLDALTVMFELEKATGVRLPDRGFEEQGLFKMKNLAAFIAEHSEGAEATGDSA
ncbi:MAG: hypothetical protein Alpg2KO_24740 [Alphaproteobacteria bacterium]